MSGPWEKYQATPAASSGKPWERYAAQAPAAPAAPEVDNLARGEAALTAASGIVGTAVGGIAGIGTYATNAMGITDLDPAEVIRNYQSALTYQPRTAGGQAATQKVAEVMDSPYNPLSWPGKAGEFAAEKAEAAGWSPEATTAMRMAPEVISAAVGAPVLKAAGNAGKVLRSERAAAPAAPAGPVAAEAATGTGFGADSLSAAASAIDLTGLPTHVQQAVQQARSLGKPINREVLDRIREAESLPIPVRLTEGAATRDAALFSREQNMRARYPQLAEKFARDNQALIDNVDAIRAEVSPSVVHRNATQNGADLIDLYRNVDAAAQNEVRSAYQALEAASGGVIPLDGVTFARQTLSELRAQRKSRFLPASLEAEIRDIASGQPLTFNDFEELRTTLAAAARKAERAGDGNEARAINIMRQQLESIPMVGGAQEVRALADHARRLARARFERIEADPAYKAIVDEGLEGNQSMLSDKFIEKYVVRAPRAALERMRENLVGDPVAQELMASGVMNYLKQKAGIDLERNTGNFTPAGYSRALGDIRAKLDVILTPEQMDRVEAIGNVAHNLIQQPKGSYVNNSNTLTGAMDETAMGVLEKIPVVGGAARRVVEGQRETKFIRQATKPGAGITYDRGRRNP